jgi:hypothetical protein
MLRQSARRWERTIPCGSDRYELACLGGGVPSTHADSLRRALVEVVSAYLGDRPLGGRGLALACGQPRGVAGQRSCFGTSRGPRCCR